ncbi:MAG: hypothetical protein KAU50_04485 [Candidatus Marinimicrobia bacterium]|nr:hypothetical protein [Candidatus Neomarinimicrobiota bacterium]
MKLEDQQVSQDLSRQLRDAGYPQEGLWWWRKNDNNTSYSLVNIGYGKDRNKFSAPTVAELGEALPHLSKCWRSRNNSWICEYTELPRPDNVLNITRTCLEASTEADARAKMWLHLKREKLI